MAEASNERLCGACGRPIPPGGSIHCGTEHAPERVSDERLAALIKYGPPWGKWPQAEMLNILTELQERRAADETSPVTSMDYGGGPFDKGGNEGPNETDSGT